MLRRQICLRITDNTSYKSSVIFEWKLDYVERKYRFFSPATESKALMQLEYNHTFLSVSAEAMEAACLVMSILVPS
jgi:hypothetical protein